MATQTIKITKRRVKKYGKGTPYKKYPVSLQEMYGYW